VKSEHFLFVVKADYHEADEDIKNLKQHNQHNSTLHAPTIAAFKFFFSV